MTFAVPEALFLLPLAALVLRRRLWPRPFVGALRCLLLAAIVLVLAQPTWPGQRDGRDIVLVVDRSRSMPAGSAAMAQEIGSRIGERLLPGDRVGLVAFGGKPVVEAAPRAPFTWPDAARAVQPDGSDLAAAIDQALALVPPGRNGSLLVVSDGEHTGGDLDAAARAAVRAGIRIDTHLAPRAAGADVAVVDLTAPSAVPVAEPFAIVGTVFAEAAGPAHWRLLGDGNVLREGETELAAGRNVLQFRRTLLDGGLHELAVEVRRAGDPVPQNDRGLVAVRATAPARILCVTPNGREDRLTRSLRGLGMDVVAAAPKNAPLTANGLDAVRCVVLEDVAAGDLVTGASTAVAGWVRNQGGGLVMTGGAASFGVGGYHRSPIEDVLPVTMEMREEQRRFGLAMAIALDRSGSMQADAGGVTKMQLADRGAATAIEMLTRIDSVTVIAVDSDAHVVVPLQAVDDTAGLSAQVRRIESMGGGIYIEPALHAAAAQLAQSTQRNRHIVLFADAADAEEPGDYRSFVPELVKAGVTVSVIGLGAASDSDAALLVEIAKLGNGRCQFVADANDLPRVFAQETIQVARSAMVEEPAAVAALPALSLLGDMPTTFPRVGGYSIAWRRPRAELALRTDDAQAAPLLSYWQCGLGRGAAYLGEIDGRLSGDFGAWERTADFLGTLVRWASGGQVDGLFVDARRDGAVGLISVEVDEARAAALDTVRGVVTTPDGRTADLVFERVAAGRLLARVPLATEGIHRAALSVDGATVRVPPLCLPYSPEFAPSTDARAGERALRRLALSTGGAVQPTVDAVLEGDRSGRGRLDLGPWCAIAAVVLLLAEILVRRLQVSLPAFATVLPRRRAPRRAVPDAVAPAPTVMPPNAPGPAPSARPSVDEPAAGAGVLGAIERAKKRTKG
ncbi:MAG: VWA domain-containing protein [Planctomycetes bacterium]|nr:VWA domain-containing protein [Planctomycetota bacterium]